ncbi:hypothetical protein BYT27DRAFT_7195795 [Phlegmacium glaucopus]|nr:hypothetical protein BYT27DRAFT_7195795 [Phlegmacium glaucopus]
MANADFDARFKLVTSDLFSPWWLASIRLLIAVYVLIVLVFILVWEAVKKDPNNTVDSYFSYFTNLSYIGICAYFFASGVQTFAYARNNKQGYPLQHWPRILRYLHGLLLSTVVTFPILVTVVYWALLSSPSTFETPYSTWSNISKHALNSVLALFEVFFTNIGPLAWLDLPVTIVILAGYLGVAYITHATQGIYPYAFLDPKKQGKLLAAYIVGIAVGQCIVFLVVTGLIHFRQWLNTKVFKQKNNASY